MSRIVISALWLACSVVCSPEIWAQTTCGDLACESPESCATCVNDCGPCDPGGGPFVEWRRLNYGDPAKQYAVLDLLVQGTPEDATEDAAVVFGYQGEHDYSFVRLSSDSSSTPPTPASPEWTC